MVVLERSQIWHAGNMFEVKEEKSVVTGYGKDYAAKLSAAQELKDKGMQSNKDVDDYMGWRELITYFDLIGRFSIKSVDHSISIGIRTFLKMQF